MNKKDCGHFVVMKGFDGKYYCRDCDEPAQVVFELSIPVYGSGETYSLPEEM